MITRPALKDENWTTGTREKKRLSFMFIPVLVTGITIGRDGFTFIPSCRYNQWPSGRGGTDVGSKFDHSFVAENCLAKRKRVVFFCFKKASENV